MVPAEQDEQPAGPFTFSQQDVSEIQLAKAAIRAGIDILLDKTGITWEAVDEVILTGGFGTVLDPAAAIDIGMLPFQARPHQANGKWCRYRRGALPHLRTRTRTCGSHCPHHLHVELMTIPAFRGEVAKAMLLFPDDEAGAE